MNIQERSVKDIKPYFKNAKEHPEKQVKKIANSIREFGFNQPIVVDKDGIIIVGHGRYIAAQLIGMDMVPVLEVDLDEERAKAYRLADNKLNESDWDMELVVAELKSLSADMVDLTGFDSNLVLETKEDMPDLSGGKIAQSQPGDIYELGRHRIICGDSTDPNTYKKLLGTERARLVFTDPPYSIDYQSGNGLTDPSSKFHKDGKIMGDDRTPEEALQFYKDVLKQLHAFTTSDMTLYWWYSPRLTDINMRSLKESKFHFSQIIIWLKNSLIYSPNQLFHRIYEPCMVAWKEGGEPHHQNLTFSKFSELWNMDQKSFMENLDIIYQKRDSHNKYIHPTQKPVQLAERAIKRSSEKNDIVLDAFGGSGSTLIACEQLDRSARLIELDPQYVDAIVGRWCKYIEDSSVVKNGEIIQWIA